MKKILYTIVLSMLLLFSSTFYSMAEEESSNSIRENIIIDDMRFYYDTKRETAEFCEYLGSDPEVYVPETIAVSGGSVTCKVTGVWRYHVIGEYERPQSAMVICNLPKTIEKINNYAFEYDNKLLTINIDENNPYLKSIDGVVYSKDGTKLIKFPGGRTGEYKLQDSTEIIEYYAFDNINLSKLICNDKLRIIKYNSINGKYLTEIILNEGLTHIANGGILCNVKTINIPSTLKYLSFQDSPGIPEYNLDGVDMMEPSRFIISQSLLEIKVSENNQYWSSYNGMLFDKDKTTLHFCPPARSNVFVPEGTKEISKSAIRLYNNSEVHIPDSVKLIGEYNFWRQPIPNKYYNTIVCYKNSTAHNYAAANNLPYRLLNGSSSNIDNDDDDSDYIYTESDTSHSASIKPNTNTNVWTHTGNNWQYVKANGQCAKNEWIFIKDKWYFFGDDANMVTEWKLINGRWYYMDSINGDMKVGWHFWHNQWYYLNPEGDMALGWKKINNKWYFLDNNGNMVTGWKLVDGKWYYMTDNGDCLINTVTPDGYTVDENGAWIN